MTSKHRREIVTTLPRIYEAWLAGHESTYRRLGARFQWGEIYRFFRCFIPEQDAIEAANLIKNTQQTPKRSFCSVKMKELKELAHAI